MSTHTIHSLSSSDIDKISEKVYKTEDVFVDLPRQYLLVPFVNYESIRCYIHHTNYDNKLTHWSEFQTCMLSGFNIISRAFSCGINSMIDCLKNVDNDMYCVLPAYFSKVHNKLSDFQLVVTGSTENHESPFETCCRELAEEIGMDGDIIHTGSYYYEKNSQRINSHVFRVHLTTPTKINSLERQINNYEINKQEKVVLIPLIENPMQLINRKRIVSADNAGESVIIFKVRMLKTLLKHFFGNLYVTKID
jgi:hypothetical protein